ncbi:MAG: NAD(P)H-binding protein [Minicystis sp.]
MTDPVLVCGASGQIGSLLRAALDDAGVPWIGLSRRSPPAGAGAQWRAGDFERPSSLGPALDGVGTVFLASSDHPRQDQLEIAMIDACRSRGVKRVVKLSAQSAGHDPPVSFGVLHARVEQALRASGMAWTLLRPVFFMQSLLFFASSIRGGKLIAPTGQGAVAFVDGRDVAAVAAAVLAHPAGHEGRVHTLTGPRALGFPALAELLSKATARRVRHISPPRWLARAVLPFVSGMPRWQSNMVVDLMSSIAAGAQSVPTNTIAEITRSEPRTIERFIDEHRATFSA